MVILGVSAMATILGMGTVVTINKKKKKEKNEIYLETNRCSCGKEPS